MSTVHSIVHDVYPAFENGHLEESQVGVAHVVKVDVGVLPGEALGQTGLPVRDPLWAGHLTSLV